MIHGADAEIGDLAERAAAFITTRIAGAPLGRAASAAELAQVLGRPITEQGLGVDAAWRTFAGGLVPNTIGLDSERFLAFIPMAPSAAAVWMDAVVGCASFAAESWLESAGAVAAENQVLRMLADSAGLADDAGGCFVSGGSIGNLSALAVARDNAGGRRAVLVADTAHASNINALHLLGLDAIAVATNDEGRLTASGLAAFGHRDDIGIVVASAGSTNGGVVDDLAAAADAAHGHGAWLHVDGAYGGAALLLPERRRLFDGIDRADSLIIDPHKWLFSTAGSCALLYRQPALAAAVHTQHGPYIDSLHGEDDRPFNPCDLAFQLTRRATGLPLWFALAVHGVEAHRLAIRRGIELAEALAKAIDACDHAEVVIRPELSVVLFRRSGWGAAEWTAWSERLLADGIAFVAPTRWRGEPVGRVVFLHPLTPDSMNGELVASLR